MSDRKPYGYQTLEKVRDANSNFERVQILSDWLTKNYDRLSERYNDLREQPGVVADLVEELLHDVGIECQIVQDAIGQPFVFIGTEQDGALVDPFGLYQAQESEIQNDVPAAPAEQVLDQSDSEVEGMSEVQVEEVQPEIEEGKTEVQPEQEPKKRARTREPFKPEIVPGAKYRVIRQCKVQTQEGKVQIQKDELVEILEYSDEGPITIRTEAGVVGTVKRCNVYPKPVEQEDGAEA